MAPYFLSRSDAYRLLQRELPPQVYPDGAPSAFYSTADMDSVAQVVSIGYTNQNIIYNNFFPQTMLTAPASGDSINQWEIAWFGVVQNTAQTIQQRIANVLSKIQLQPGINLPYIEGIAGNIISPVPFDVIEWGNFTGGWMLAFSELAIDTFLNGSRGYDVIGANICPCFGGFGGGNCSPPNGLTLQQIADAQQEAYTYEVRIYGTITATQLTALNKALTAAEPARSTHVITQGLNPADQINGTS